MNCAARPMIRNGAQYAINVRENRRQQLWKPLEMAPVNGPVIVPTVAKKTRPLCSGPSSTAAFVIANVRTMNTISMTRKAKVCAFVRPFFIGFLANGELSDDEERASKARSETSA